MPHFCNPRCLLVVPFLFLNAACASLPASSVPFVEVPPFTGFFLDLGDSSYQEMDHSTGPPEDPKGIPKTNEPLPRIIQWPESINPELLHFRDQAGYGEEKGFTFERQKNGVVVLSPTASLAPDVYCFVLEDPQVIGGTRSHWCFAVGDIAVAEILAAAAPSSGFNPLTLSDAPMIETNSGLLYQDDVIGDGPEAVPGALLTVHYTGWLVDGTQFDSSVDRGTPFNFQLSVGAVIPGWDLGLVGMQVGGVRILHIPPELAYGAPGAPPAIPPNATLIFRVELLEVILGTEQLQP